MAEPYQLLTFSAGEVGRQTLARTDLANAPKWAEIAENVLLDTLGGFSKAPGTLFLRETPSSSITVLRPFVFSADVALVLELSNQLIRFVSGETYLTMQGPTTTNGGFADVSGAVSGGGGAPPGEGSGGIGDPIGGGDGSSGRLVGDGNIP